MRGRIIHYNGNDGKGIILAEDRQVPFDITQWSSDSAPAVNQMVEISVDDVGTPMSIAVVHAQTLAKERLNQFTLQSGDQSQQTAAKGKAIFQQLRSRMGTTLMVVCAVLFVAWFIFPALSVRVGLAGRTFSIFDILGLDLQAGVSFGFWSLLGLVAVLLPWLTPSLRARWASLFLCAPLLMIIVAFAHVRWQIHASVARAIDQANQLGGPQAEAIVQGMVDQITANAGKAVSFDFGFWVVLLISVYLAFIGIKRYMRSPSTSPATA